MLDDYFASVFEVEVDQDLPIFPEQPFTQMLEHIEITNILVSKAMKKVNPSKSRGPDMIQPKIHQRITSCSCRTINQYFS